jgi:hypothetical protein
MNIQTAKLDFDKSRACFLAFLEEYNQEKPSKERLKFEHMETFHTLLRLYRNELIEQQRLYKDTPSFYSEDPQEISIYTNRHKLARFKLRHYDTVGNYLSRLDKSGAIKKIFHGSRKDLEIKINKDLLLICHVNNEEICTQSKYLASTNSTKKQGIQSELTVKSISKDRYIKNNSNIIIPVNNVEKVSAKADDNSLKNPLKNTVKQEPKIDLARKKPIEIAKIQAISWFYMLVMDTLFAGRPEIYPAEIKKARQIIATYYFTDCKTPKQLTERKAEYENRVNLAKKYLEKHPETYANFQKYSYPSAWLDPNNKNGFAGTKKWHETQQTHTKTRKAATEFEKFMKKFAYNPTKYRYESGLQEVKRKFPEKERDYLRHFASFQHITLQPSTAKQQS